MMLQTLHCLLRHLIWADARLWEALSAQTDGASDPYQELAHIVGAEEVWLARLQGRPARIAVWPEADPAALKQMMDATHRGFEEYLSSLDEAALEAPTAYVNSAGQGFTNTVRDILLHVFLHGQYHRGKVNLLLRTAGQAPAPADFIAYLRGVAAATRDS
jgi:uncharacterized damage-inducible protein DinB